MNLQLVAAWHREREIYHEKSAERAVHWTAREESLYESRWHTDMAAQHRAMAEAIEESMVSHVAP